MNLRELAIKDCKNLNTKDWGSPLELMSPDGIWYKTDAETGALLQALQILRDYRKLDPATGGEIIVYEPVVVVAISSLFRVPQAGERWLVRFKESPTSQILSDFILTEDRAPEGGSSLGLIRLYPQKVEQSS
jgi:hypothetical protein